MLDVKFSTNGPFSKMLNRRVEAWSGRTIEMGIHTPEDISWWYYNEFGTATQATGPARRTGRYRISPRPPNRWLTFPWDGALASFPYVMHPGTKASHFTLLASPQYRKAVREAFKAAMKSGGADDPQKLRVALLESMELARQQIAESMGRTLQQSSFHDDGYGKLKGRRAQDVYLERAQVVDNSS